MSRFLLKTIPNNINTTTKIIIRHTFNIFFNGCDRL